MPDDNTTPRTGPRRADPETRQAPSTHTPDTATCTGTATPATQADLGLAPEDGDARTAMQHATALAATQIEARMRHPGAPKGFITEINDLTRAARQHHAIGRRLSHAGAARLSVLLGVVRLRDEAWASITAEHLHAHVAAWTDMTRRSVVNVAACASLLAFACWLIGDSTRARLAIKCALAADADYGMAHLMTELLARTDPPADTEDTKTPTTGGDATFRG